MAPRFVSRIIQRALRPSKEHRRSQFAILPLPDVDVVFIGDSITEQGIWTEWFPKITSANRGISAETSSEVVGRLDTVVANAKLAFVLIGTNDIALGIPEDEIVANTQAIVEHVLRTAPGVKVVLESVMPRQLKFRDRVLALNRRLVDVAARTGAEYLDLWPIFTFGEGQLNPSYTVDELHLNGAGYKAWVELLTPLITANVGHAPA